jgi:hypothetical protein
MFAASEHTSAAGLVAPHDYRAAATPIDATDPPLAEGTRAIVRADGDCLNLRTAPTIGASKIVCLPEGSFVTVTGASVQGPEFRWAPVTNGALNGWAADLYLEPAPIVAATPPPPVSTTTTDGTPNVFAAPNPGRFRLGVSGTDDPAALAAAQSFPVEAIFKLNGNGQWLFFLVGAPSFVNTLTTVNLFPTDIVLLKRSLTSTTSTAQRVQASISYYYCEQGTIVAGIGDGGGFCGAMANGQVVYEGASACASGKMGQKFRILGDPTARIYTCADTGSAVTGEHRDIFFHNSDDGYNWWKQVGNTATIEILN